MRVETINGRHLLCGHILHRVHLKAGQKWAPADGSDRQVTIQSIDGDWITYGWYETDGHKSHVKDWFSFQCRYCLVLDEPDIPDHIFFYPPSSAYEETEPSPSTGAFLLPDEQTNPTHSTGTQAGISHHGKPARSD